MAISENKKRIRVTLHDDIVALIKRDAKRLNASPAYVASLIITRHYTELGDIAFSKEMLPKKVTKN